VDRQKPYWWDWEFDFSRHVLERMVDRGFGEIDLRLMIESGLIVEPDLDTHTVVVITAFGVD